MGKRRDKERRDAHNKANKAKAPARARQKQRLQCSPEKAARQRMQKLIGVDLPKEEESEEESCIPVADTDWAAKSKHVMCLFQKTKELEMQLVELGHHSQQLTGAAKEQACAIRARKGNLVMKQMKQISMDIMEMKEELKQMEFDRDFRVDDSAAELVLHTRRDDQTIQQTIEGNFAYPVGLHSFVDTFEGGKGKTIGQSSIEKVPRGRHQRAVRKSGRFIYQMEGEMLQTQGIEDMEEEYKAIEVLQEIMTTNMAEGEYRAVPGYGDVRHVGLRYRYQEPTDSGRDKLESYELAGADDKENASRYSNCRQHIQKIGNRAVFGVEGWGRTWRHDMKEQRRLMDRLLGQAGSACFTFPSCSMPGWGWY